MGSIQQDVRFLYFNNVSVSAQIMEKSRVKAAIFVFI